MPKFVPRQRKHRVLARQKAQGESTTPSLITTAPSNTTTSYSSNGDSNTVEMLPTGKQEREDKKRQLREEIRASQPKMSSKKQKRLDKYIDTKLRKDETVALIKRLESRQKNVDTSLFQSAKVLGRGKETKREELRRALGEKRAGIGGEQTDNILFERPRNRTKEQYVEEEEESKEDQGQTQDKDISPALQTVSGNHATSFGSGLKRPLDLDEEGKPIIKKRKRTRGPAIKVDFPILQAEEPEWEGFSEDMQSEMSSEEDSHTTESDEEGSQISTTDLQDLDAVREESENDGEADSSGTEEASSSEEEEEEEEEDLDEFRIARKTRTSAFKAWAEQQRNEALGFAPSTVIGSVPVAAAQATGVAKLSFTPRPEEQDPLPDGYVNTTSIGIERRAHAVHVERPEDIQTARLELPILAEEQRIMEAIFNNDVVVVSGATGSGKTTQVPQFLYENGFGDHGSDTPGLIGVTQPRRVAAVSMAKRVADELGNAGSKVAHQIRFDTTVGKQTAIKFMTDGVLLREMSEDFSLKKYSAIVIDEAHERTVNTDILISLMSRCIKIRRQLAKEKPETYSPLKLVIMSATLRVSDFRENHRLFSEPPPLIQGEGRQYEVTPHWSRKTSHDYIEEAFRKVSRGHRKLPSGGMLVFLTGQNEIRMLAKRLKQMFKATDVSSGDHPQVRVSAAEMPVEAEDLDTMDTQQYGDEVSDVESDDDSSTHEAEDPDAEFVIEGESPEEELMKIHVLPLYSQLPSKEQLKVFAPPPPGSRLIVLATNVAETSLTIPGIRYVFDSGRHKERIWDRAGVQTFRTTWISKASADQRMGRAGRTGPGHCYRLYSSAIYEAAMPEFAEPEIYRTPLEGVVLQLKTMNISRVDNFPFPTPPDRSNLVKAERLLRNLGALDAKGRITKLGRELQNYPLNPRFAQMLRLGTIYGCTVQAIAIVAALDVPEILVPESQLDLRTPDQVEGKLWTEADNQAESLREKRRHAYNTAQAKLSRLDFTSAKVTPQSDALKLFAAMYDYSSTITEPEVFCKELFIREKGIREATQLRDQLTSIIRNLNPSAISGQQHSKTPKPTTKQIALLKQIVAAGFIDQIAIRTDLLPTPPAERRKPKRAIDVRYKTLFSSSDPDFAATNDDGDRDQDSYVYIHPSSILARLPATQVPRYIIYLRLQRSQPSAPGKKSRVRMHPLTPVSAEQVAVLARGTSLLEIGKPMGKIGVLPSEKGNERREVYVMLSLVGEGGGVGWPLKRQRVIQKRVPGEGWVVERWID